MEILRRMSSNHILMQVNLQHYGIMSKCHLGSM